MRKVLIVEPNAADAQALKHILREAGLPSSALVLRNGSEARHHLRLRDGDAIIFLNIHSPDAEGMDFLEWLRQQSFGNDIFVVAVGERGQLRRVAKACERGAQTFIIKPVHAEDLKAVARTYPDQWDRRPE